MIEESKSEGAIVALLVIIHTRMSKTHITFDFFGTLVGYTHGHFTGNQEYTSSHKFLVDSGYPIDYEVYMREFSNTFDDMAKEFKPTKREFHMYDVASRFFETHFKVIPNQKIIHQFVELYIDEWNSAINYLPGINDLLTKLKKKYKLAIISNTHYPSLIHRNLKAMKITDYFDLIVTSVEFGTPKPDRSIFDHTVSRLGTMHDKVIHIGDNYSDDYVGAIEAGIDSVLIDSGNKKYETRIKKVNNLFEIENLL